jgi:hypothetical protein
MDLPFLKKRYHKIIRPLIFTLLLQKHAIGIRYRFVGDITGFDPDSIATIFGIAI